MEEQLVACARQLFEGIPGSNEQRAANEWLMMIQRQEEAWEATLHVLTHPPCDPSTEQPLEAPMLVAMQILRLKVHEEWLRMGDQQKQFVRQTLLHLLGNACTSRKGAFSPTTFRIACVTIGGIIAKSCREWTTWKNDLQVILDASLKENNPLGAKMLVDVLGCIPDQIVSSASIWTHAEMASVIKLFEDEYSDVMRTVQMIFSSMGLLDLLFDAVTCENEEQSQLAAEIIADVLASSGGAPVTRTLIEAVSHTGVRVLASKFPLEQQQLSQHDNRNQRVIQTTICKGLSRIASSLAINHGATLFTQEWSNAANHGADMTSFRSQFLEYLLNCSAYEDIDVVQPTLEFWFFFLDSSAETSASWRLLDVPSREHALSVLGRLVNALINHCKYPRWFIDLELVTCDDPDIEAINLLRREIADTLLSLFSKWPDLSSQSNGSNFLLCVRGMTALIETSSDVALVDAILYLLEYMIELFDIDSSDSDSDEEHYSPQTSEGILLLQGVLNCSHHLPTHPLIIHGVARYMRSLSLVLVLPGETYVHVSNYLCRGLRFSALFATTTQALLYNSDAVVKYTNISERGELLHHLVSFCNSFPNGASKSAKGDLLEATFRLISGISNSEFGGFCNKVLAELFTSIQSANIEDVCSGIYLLGRAISGVQDSGQGAELVNQIWGLASESIARCQSDAECRKSTVQFFLNVISHLNRDQFLIQRAILEITLQWYSEKLFPDILKCYVKVIEKEHGNAEFVPTAEHLIEHVVTVIRRKLNDNPAYDFDAGKQSMEAFFAQHQNVELVGPEVVAFMNLLSQVLRSFPLVLFKPRQHGEPSLYWISVRLASILLDIDHQMQEICDAVCDFLLDAMLGEDIQLVHTIEHFSVTIVHASLQFLSPNRRQYRQRNIWDFLFQLLHSLRIPVAIRDCFKNAVATIAVTNGLLQSLLPQEICQQVPSELCRLHQRHRFRQYLTQLARLIEDQS